MVIFPKRGAVGCKKSKKKILMDFFPCGFPISSNKKGGKGKWFSFLLSEERENVI